MSGDAFRQTGEGFFSGQPTAVHKDFGFKFFNKNALSIAEYKKAAVEFAKTQGIKDNEELAVRRFEEKVLQPIKDIGGFSDTEVLQEFVDRREQDAVTAEVAEAEAAGQAAADEEAAVLGRRASRRKSRNVAAQSILSPVPSGRPRLKNILGVG